MVRVVAPEIAFQQLDAERLELVDVARAGEPAIDRADMPLGGAGPDLAREQRPHRRAGRGFRRQQIDALLAAPACVALDGGLDRLPHGARVGAGVEHGASRRERFGIVRLDPVFPR